VPTPKKADHFFTVIDQTPVARPRGFFMRQAKNTRVNPL
jgi:hypothetical protein